MPEIFLRIGQRFINLLMITAVCPPGPDDPVESEQSDDLLVELVSGSTLRVRPPESEQLLRALAQMSQDIPEAPAGAPTQREEDEELDEASALAGRMHMD